ncbi:MAG: cupredoxin domain-containing protein [Candidatus Limnocylindria bacterium]
MTHDADDPLFDESVAYEASVDITFSEPGRIDIVCTPHHGMEVTVFVEG